MFRLRQTAPTLAEPDTLHVTIAGESVVVRVRRHGAARRLTLRVPPGEAAPVLTLPPGATRPMAERFLDRNADWLRRHLTARVAPRPFLPGVAIPVRGEPHVVRHVPGARGTAWLAPACGETGDGPAIMVAGAEEHVPRRVADGLRKWARADLVEAVATFSAAVGRRPAAVRIKDTRSQWGSCSSRGVLSFSWRLVLAPPLVLRYVAAHEVAHLVHMNHGRAFWRLNAALVPEIEEARAWLNAHGRTLHAYGVAPGQAG